MMSMKQKLLDLPINQYTNKKNWIQIYVHKVS